MGPMGPQDSKWKNVYIKDKPLSDKISKIKSENLLKTKHKIDDYGASQFPMENLPTHIPENENTRNIQKQNEWLRQYSKEI